MNTIHILDYLKGKTLIILLLLISLNSIGQITREEYIDEYKNLAIKEMKRAGIPASITMAQALLESNNGNSRLAKRAKNHFGIKCQDSWKGKKFHQDDDKSHECFRKYNSVEESYKDHSEFLKKERYAFLFDLDILDYKGWARGLKKAGYATNSKYPQLLISIIEENNLTELDEQASSNTNKKTKVEKKSNNNDDYEPSTKEVNSNKEPKNSTKNSNEKREISVNNRVKYIVVKEGDTFESITKELDLLSWQLTKYNEISNESTLKPGTFLYLQPKRNKGEIGTNIHRVQGNETLYDISQKYAIKLDKLREINLIIEGVSIKEGDIIYLRKKKL